MALHTDLPIYATGSKLLAVSIRIQVQLPRAVKRTLGEVIQVHCVDMLNSMALANASMRSPDRAKHIEHLLEIQRAVQILLRICFDEKFLSRALWGEATLLMDAIGRQAGGWLNINGEVWRGEARRGADGLGTARRALARHGWARLGRVWLVLAWLGLVGFGLTRMRKAWTGRAGSGSVRHGQARRGQERHGWALHGLVRHGMGPKGQFNWSNK